jgi:hypothetical protein
MKPVIDPNEWSKEFQDLINAVDSVPTAKMSQRILSKVAKDLNPPVWVVFTRLTFLVLAVGTITLRVCPHLGIDLFPGMGSFFSGLGETICMILCGGIFFGAGALAGSLILRPEEVKIIRHNKVLQLALLAILSVVTYIYLGDSIVATLGFAWIAGSTLSGLATLEIGWYIRSHFRRKFIYGL